MFTNLPITLSNHRIRALKSLVVDAYFPPPTFCHLYRRHALNFPERQATDAFLKAHEAYCPYIETDFDQDLKSIDQALA